MKKTLITSFIFLFALIMIPNLVFASWWNPFSWFNKHSEVKEIIKEPADFSKYETVIATSTIKQELEKKVPVVNKSEQEKTTSNTPVYTPKVETLPPANTSLCNGNYYTNCSLGTTFVCPENGKAYCTLPKTNDQICRDSFGDNSIYSGKTNNVGGLVCSCKTGYELNSSKTSCQKSIANIDTEEVNNDQGRSQESAECVSAKKAYNNINDKIEKNRELSDKEDDPTSERSRELTSKGADLAIESIAIKNKYYSACYNTSYIVTPPKTYNTTCYDTGYSIKCTTY